MVDSQYTKLMILASSLMFTCIIFSYVILDKLLTLSRFQLSWLFTSGTL